MKPLTQPLFWHQGLFLQPHHFQYQDAWTTHTLARQLDLVMPWGWGVAALQVDESALAACHFVIDALTLRWPDGTLTEYPGNSRIESVRFELADFAQGPRTLYVGLRRQVEGQPNVQKFANLDDAAQANARMVVPADPHQVPDLYADGPAGRITLMTYVLRLFWEDELDNLGSYDLMPIARIEQDGEVVRMTPRFVPPCLNLAASSQLQMMLRELRDEVIGRARQLEVFKQPVTARSDDTQYTPMLALSVLNRYGPQINHLLESMQTHPWIIYGILRQLAGELSTFSEFCDLLGETRDSQQLVPPYKHTDIGAACTAITNLIRRLLNEITVGPEMRMRFEQDGTAASLHHAEMPADFFGPRHRYYLMARSTAVDTKTMNELILLDGKLGAPDHIDTLVTRSLPGLELLPLQTLPLGMPRRAGATYFRVENLSDAWDEVLRSRRLSFFLPSPPADLRLELIVIKG